MRQRWYWQGVDGHTLTELTTATAAGKYMFTSRFRRVLTITRLTVDDAGLYRCEATYRTSSGREITLNAEAQLTVHGTHQECSRL